MSRTYCGSNARSISRNRVTREHVERGQRDEYLSEDPVEPECLICSYKQPYPSEPIPIYHRHFSTINLRKLLGVEESRIGYYCPTCKSRHRPYIDDRLRVVVSDSTLHDFYTLADASYGSYEGDLLHTDYLTIKDGTIPDLLLAFKQEYAHPLKSLDVVVVAGYADIAQHFSREFILQGLNEFAEFVLRLDQGAAPSTFAVSSLMYPPRYCWFSENGPVPYRYHNFVEKFDWLNAKIHELNLNNNVPAYPCFHTYGTRKTTRSVINAQGDTELQHVRGHRWEHWAEQARREKVTLRVDRRFKLGKAINNYFVYRT